MARDVRAVAAGGDWIKMIVPDEAAADVVAGNVVLWDLGVGSLEDVFGVERPLPR